ncbi:G-protein beta WD 40 repeat-containing protein [Penicillium pulvis]|uniref:G-protein beta WD 40 repeat-containing protein n=1 Tax=Penicillium pulvis TaxID=1562058 RepID=UPI0025493191|nr:G-protein beta WD 40 repeat-containing protein [Penicillium pulvis]KAJ5805828.1 G-protein beta WD 40 repeat-containing protein [Penicillium pulvis]
MTSQISKCGTCGPYFYLRAFEQLRMGDVSDIKGCIRLLQVITLSYRPLRLEEFASVSGLSTEESTLEAWVDRCASFLIIRGDCIYLVHKSAQDFLKGESGQSLLDSYEPFRHKEIALSCTLKDEDLHILLDSVDYAATFWVQHLCDVHPTDLSQKGLIGEEIVMVFFHKKFLEWLECLSLLNRLPHAFDGLKALENQAELVNLLKDRHPVSIFARDAKRFFLRHYHTLEKWPLQAYSSAIIFSPQSCVVRTSHIDKMPEWLEKTPSMEKTWTALIQEIGHTSRIRELAISPDCKRIVSRCIDRDIKL